MTPHDSHYTAFELAQGRGDRVTNPTVKNEAAERLRGKVHYSITHGVPVYDAELLLDAALEEERRLTVERIRAALTAAGFVEDESNDVNAILSILDGEVPA